MIFTETHTKVRMDREKRTMGYMIAIYCHGCHSGGRGLCRQCQDLQEYAFRKIEKCPFQKKKPVCTNCTVHCYQPERREAVREVMRFSGPKMIWRHPILTIMHFKDSVSPWRA